MGKYTNYLALIFMLFCSCHHNGTRPLANDLKSNIRHNTTPVKPDEVFIDSTNIGRRSFNKVELTKYSNEDGHYVIIRFYSKRNNSWQLRNAYNFLKDGINNCDVELSDFNGDGLNDLTYKSGVAARGANDLRKLLIYDKVSDKLTCIKNSDDYPNLLYNKELHCIDAFWVYGGCSTVFLKIDADTLIEFASVELFDGLTVATYDKNNKEKIILRDTSVKTEYTRYKNFNPLKEYDGYQ
jgi:hypothetical protein